MADVTLELIKPEEFDRFSDWFSEDASDYLSGMPENLAAMLSESIEPLAWRLVLGRQTLALIIISVNSSRIGKINLVVDPRVRRRGVGSAAIRQILKQPEVKELRGLEGEVAASNIGAQKILIKNGFTKAGYGLEGDLRFRLN